MKIIVTGARGLIGRALSASLRENGHDVVPLSLRANFIPKKSADVAFHLAHDHRRENTAALIAWYTNLEDAWRIHVGRQIYVSSYSARADAQSVYGRTKYSIERQFVQNGHSIIRPGLVLGPGGTFGAMLKLLQASPIIPVPGGNRVQVPYISLSRLCKLMIDLPQGESNLFSPNFVGLQDLLEKVAKQKNLHRLFLTVPSRLVLGGLRSIEAFGLRLPVNSDNLLGLLVNQRQIHYSSCEEEALERALKDLDSRHFVPTAKGRKKLTRSS
jgi:nucleoside-diphosphate-sugar epimerase